MAEDVGAAASLSFDEFFGNGYPRLVRTVTAMAGRRAVAEEIAQEAMLAAYRRWDVVGRLDRPDLWVRRVAVNRMISVHRRALAEVAALTRIASWRVPEIDTALRDDELWSAVRRLPGRQRSAIVLSIEGHTAREIAEVLECGEETAQTHIRRARRRLAQLLDEEDSP